MSDYHILQISQSDGGMSENISIVFHIPVPDQANKAGVSYRTAIASLIGTDELGNPVVSSVPWLEADFPQEYADIQAGIVYEVSKMLRLPAEWTPIQKQDRIDAYYNTLKGELLAEAQQRFSFWGFNRNVEE